VRKDEVKTQFGLVVKAWRSRRGFSQEELAGRAGLHRTYVSDVERGSRNVSLASIDRLASALEVSVAQLFSNLDPAAGEPSPIPAAGNRLATWFATGKARSSFCSVKAVTPTES